MCGDGGDGSGDAPGSGVSGLGPAGVSEGSDIGASHGGQASASGPSSEPDDLGIEASVSAAIAAMDPTTAPTSASAGFGRGTATAMGLFGMGPIGPAMSIGAAMAAAGGSPDSASSGSGVGSQGDVGGGQGGGARELGDNINQTVGQAPSTITQPASSDDGVTAPPAEPTPITLPDLEPDPEPEPELTDSEEAQRLRRARRYFGLGGTNVTGPLGLQSPAPVYRPSATPVQTAKRKLGA